MVSIDQFACSYLLAYFTLLKYLLTSTVNLLLAMKINEEIAHFVFVKTLFLPDLSNRIALGPADLYQQETSLDGGVVQLGRMLETE